MDKRIAILSQVIPPQTSGQSIVLSRLIEGLDPANIILISNNKVSRNNDVSGYRSFTCNTLFSHINKYFVLIPYLLHYIGQIEIYLRYIKLRKILKREKITTLIVCSGDLFNFPVAAKCCESLGVELIPYIFDDYIFQWKIKLRKLASWYEKKTMFMVNRIIVPNEFTLKEYTNRYGINCHIIRNIASDKFTLVEFKNKSVTNSFKIGFFGTIYYANIDRFINLLDALDKYKGVYDFKLVIYTPQSESIINELFFNYRHLFSLHKSLGDNEIIQKILDIDILYLPLSSNKDIATVINSSAPGKLSEYLFSGKPIFAHVPDTSFVKWYFVENNLKYTLESNENEQIISTLNLIVSDLINGESFVNNQHIAKRDFTPFVVRENFKRLIFNKQIHDV